MRAIWKGSISFGLVYIPIAVYPATREERLSFRQLRATDLSPIRYKKVADVDQKEVTADQIVKGFEYERGNFVVLKEEDFAKVRIEFGKCGEQRLASKEFTRGAQRFDHAPLQRRAGVAGHER